MGNFFTDVIKRDARFNGTKRVADLALLEPKTRELVSAIVADAAAAGVKLMVFETFRSQARQTELFRQGATQLEKVGVHHFGLAADLVKEVHGEPSWKGSFDFLQALAKKHGMIWGGDWGTPGSHHSFVDPVHVQRVTVGRQNGLFNGTWYPDEDYDPYRDH